MPIVVKAYVQMLYGGMPPPLKTVKTTLENTLAASTHWLQIWAIRVGDPSWLEWHLKLHLPFSFAKQNFPSLPSLDGCWPHVINTEAIHAVLEQGVCLAHFDRLQIGVIGHSRGGKAALLAGATDPHTAMTVTHKSDCAGTASFQINDGTAETLVGLVACRSTLGAD